MQHVVQAPGADLRVAQSPGRPNLGISNLGPRFLRRLCAINSLRTLWGGTSTRSSASARQEVLLSGSKGGERSDWFVIWQSRAVISNEARQGMEMPIYMRRDLILLFLFAVML